MSRTAAIYARISKDREGAGLGVERQEQDCRALAERLGWDVTAVHADNDLSAYSGKPRPGYEALIADLKAGRADAVLAWHTDRLHRSPVELEAFIAVCEEQGVAVQTVQAGEVDLSTPSGRAVARTLGAWARHEVEHMVARQRRAKEQAAAAGKFRGGARPFGYESDGVTVRPSEAAVVRDMTERILAGESLHSLVRELNRREVRSSLGREWTTRTLRAVLLRARNAGFVEHNGEVVADAEWPAIVDPAQWRNVCRLLLDKDRQTPWTKGDRWLGSGLFLCGVCNDGTTMLSARTRSKTTGNHKTPAYRCRAGSHLTRIAEPVDDFIAELVIRRLSRPDARLLLAPEDRRPDLETLHARRADLAARETELAGLFAEGVITGPQLAEGTRSIRAQVETLDAQIGAATTVSPLNGFANAEDIELAWKAAPVSRRKAVIKALMTVTLLPAAKGRPKGWRAGAGYFDPRFIQIDWKG